MLADARARTGGLSGRVERGDIACSLTLALGLIRLTSVTFPGSRTVSYAFDDAGRRTSMTYPAAATR